MNPTEITVDSLVVKSQIDAITEITISDWTPKKIGQSRVPIVYNGRVKSGTGSSSIDAYIFCYKVLDDDNLIPQMLHKQCSTISHPNVMRSLGYGRGSKEYSGYMFVAFPIFDKTFSDYLRSASGATEMGRFSTPFIQIVRDIVNGLEALSLNGFGCPELKATHIAIKTEGNSLTAKIWNFSKCNSAESRDNAWVLLGRMFLDAMNMNYAPDSLEIQDLCKKMIKGNLKGIAILKHSALLTVQEKFANVLALWRHVSLHCKQQLGQPGGGQGLTPQVGQQRGGQGLTPQVGQQRGGQGTPQVGQRRTGAEPSKIIVLTRTLEEYLDLEGTIENRPQWIRQIRTAKSPKTFRELLDELRDIIEHEIEYKPPSEGFDLEYWFRNAWEKDFLKIQLWASNPRRKIKEEVKI